MRYKIKGRFEYYDELGRRGCIVSEVEVKALTVDKAVKIACQKIKKKVKDDQFSRPIGVTILEFVDENGVVYEEIETAPPAVANAIANSYGHRGGWKDFTTKHWQPKKA